MSPSPALPEEIRLELLPEGLRYVMPVREQSRSSRLMRALTAAIGAGVIAIGVVLVTSAFGAPMLSGVLTAFGIAIAIGGVILLVVGLTQGRWREVIELRGDTIARRTLGSPFSWWRRRRVANVRRLSIEHLLAGAPKVPKWLGDTNRLAYGVRVHMRRGRPLMLAEWYPAPLLQGLAAHLAEEIGVEVADQSAETPAAEETEQREAPERPEWSDVLIEQTADGLSIIVPPAPIFGKGRGTTTSPLFNTIAASAGGIWFYAIFLGGGLTSPFTWMWLIFTLPAASGWFSLLNERLANREVYLDVVGDDLLVNRRTLRGVQQHHWPRESVRSIRCGPSSIEVDDEHLPQLQIITIDGESHGLLTGRAEEELKWLAWTLRQALELSDRAAGQ